jgi:hypothetical protein
MLLELEASRQTLNLKTIRHRATDPANRIGAIFLGSGL